MSFFRMDFHEENCLFQYLHLRYWSLLRIAMGWVFFWPFLDKTFGLGFSTCNVDGVATFGCDDAWINGGSPTHSFLMNATQGPFEGVFQSLANSTVVECLFMIGLLAIGVALIGGIGTQIAGYCGSVMLVMLWLAVLPPEQNPFLDDHLIYAIICLALANKRCGDTWGFGKLWSTFDVVKKHQILK